VLTFYTPVLYNNWEQNKHIPTPATIISTGRTNLNVSLLLPNISGSSVPLYGFDKKALGSKDIQDKLCKNPP
jgi:hypothetical protein